MDRIVYQKDRGRVVLYGHCPNHDDRKPSLFAGLYVDSGVLFVKCFAGCHINGTFRESIREQLLSYCQENDIRLGQTLHDSGNQLATQCANHVYNDEKDKIELLDDSEAVIRFAKERCIDSDIAEKFLRSCRFVGRTGIAIQIVELSSGSKEYKQVRLTDGREPRYLNVSSYNFSCIYRGGNTLLITEGVLKGLTLYSYLRKIGKHDGYTIIAAMSATIPDRAKDELNAFVRDCGIVSVVVCQDNDDAGARFADRIAGFISGLPVYSIDYSLLANRFGVELKWSEKGKHGIDDVIISAVTKNPNINADPIAIVMPKFSMVSLSSICPQSATFLFDGLVPLGAITIIEGDPGVGKSFLTIAMAIACSSGGVIRGLNGCIESVVSGPVLMLANEDEMSVIANRATRLNKTGSALDNVYVSDEILSLPEDYTKLISVVDCLRPKLVVIDPIMSYLSGKTDVYRDQSVRLVLSPLLKIARTYQMAIVLVRHLRKQNGTQQTKVPHVYQGVGSIGFLGLSRSVLRVSKDGDYSSLQVIKSNYAPTDFVFNFSIRGLSVLPRKANKVSGEHR
ncbi:MAG: AAA family ATPase [Nitrososphaerales archaeon]